MWTRQSLQEDGEDREGESGGGREGSARLLALLSRRFHQPAGGSSRSLEGVGDWHGPACRLGSVGGEPVGVEGGKRNQAEMSSNTSKVSVKTQDVKVGQEYN